MDLFSGAPEIVTDIALIKRAIITELGADNTYQDILDVSTNAEVHAVIKEIQADEQNHLGRLLALAIRLEGGENGAYYQHFSAGFNGAENG